MKSPSTDVTTEAVCLKLIPYRENDVIAAFYTADNGLIRAVCRGVKKPKQTSTSLAGACQLLTLNQLVLKPGKGLYTLKSYSRRLSFDDIRGDLNRLGQASIWAEIIYQLGEDTDSAGIFTLLLQSLSALSPEASPGNEWQAVTILFHRRLLELAGYGNDWTHCVHCGAELELLAQVALKRPLLFVARLGSFVCDECVSAVKAEGHTDLVKVSPQTILLALDPFGDLAERPFGEASASVGGSELDDPEARQRYFDKLHAFFRYIWTFRLEKPLKSFDVVGSLT